MISFNQLLILVCFTLLLFGDVRKIFKKLVLFFVNLKTVLKKDSESSDQKKSSNQ